MQLNVLEPGYQNDLRALWQELRQERPHLCRITGAELLDVSDYALLHADERCTLIPLNDHFVNLYRDLSKLGPVCFRLQTADICHEVTRPLGLCHEHLPQLVLCEGATRVMAQAGWWHGVAVKEKGWREYHHSLQFFDERGRLSHSITAVAGTDMAAWRALLLRYNGVSKVLPKRVPAVPVTRQHERWVDCEQLREHWFAHTRHEQEKLCQRLGLKPLEAVGRLGSDVAQRLPLDWLPGICARLSRWGLTSQLVAKGAGAQHQHAAQLGRTSLLGHWLNIHQSEWNLHVRLQSHCQLWLVKNAMDGCWGIRLFDAQGDVLLCLLPDPRDVGQQWVFHDFLQQLVDQQVMR